MEKEFIEKIELQDVRSEKYRVTRLDYIVLIKDICFRKAGVSEKVELEYVKLTNDLFWRQFIC